jgi:acetyl-CoA synthetase
MIDGSMTRFLRPKSIALIGGGGWTDAVAAGNRVVGFAGPIWRVHPHRPSTAENPCYRTVEDLPAPPDTAFVAVPAREVPAVAASLAHVGAGGFVCFAAGFSELDTPQGHGLTHALLDATPGLPFLGPNCYGFVNFFDRAALWPDQVVGTSPARGVALICQSGTIALTLMFGDRSLPIGYVLTVGNQTRVGIEDLVEALCDDDRVSAFGIYVEGIKEPERFVGAAARARAAGKPIALVKTGRTESAARTTRTHTGALSGTDAVFDAMCRQAAIARCETLSTLCETLKVFHAGGPLPGRRVLVMGASGGDMAMTADLSSNLGLSYPPIPTDPAARLSEILGGRVTVANPFDMHTYTWFDSAAQRALFDTTLSAGFDAVAYVLDSPPEDKADVSAFSVVIDQFVAAARAHASTSPQPSRAVLLASLPETLSPRVREQCLRAGVVPLQGQREALEALDLAGAVGETWNSGATLAPLWQPGLHERMDEHVDTLDEVEAKAALAEAGVPLPQSRLVPATNAAAAAVELGWPVVMKAAAAGLMHKSEVGGVILGIDSPSSAAAAAEKLGGLSEHVLIEEQVTDGVAEILVGVIRDAQFGLALVIGAGGVMTELLRDSTTLLPPFAPSSIIGALERLAVAPLLRGFRGKPAGDVPALVEAIVRVARYAERHASRLVELDVNPIIVRPAGYGVVAVDALIRLAKETST